MIFLKNKLIYRFQLFLILGITLIFISCSSSIRVRSFPTEAKVYIKDIMTGDKREIGSTPLDVKRSENMGDVFFFTIEKDEFLPRDILVKSGLDENIFINAKLEPKEEKLLAEQLGMKPEPQGKDKPDEQKKKMDEQEKLLKDLQQKLSLLDNTLTTYKDALFSQRYIGKSRFDDRSNDKVLKLIFNAQKNILNKKYAIALKQLEKALSIDEYLAQAHLLKGSIYYIGKNYVQARASWERAMEIDPYNGDVIKYLQRLYPKVGLSSKTALQNAMELRKQQAPTVRQPASVTRK